MNNNNIIIITHNNINRDYMSTVVKDEYERYNNKPEFGGLYLVRSY